MALIIITLVIVLTVKANKDKFNNETPADDPTQDSSQNGEEEPEDIITYASSFRVNLPSTINILVGCKVELLSGYVEVQPSEMQSQIKVDLKPRYNSSAFGLELNNSTLIGKEAGTYNLTISVPRSEGTNFSETILITVFSEQSNAHVTQLNEELVQGSTIEITTLFQFSSNLSFIVATDSKLTYSNHNITANDIGTSNIRLTFTNSFVNYYYDFIINIKAEPQYVIVLENVTDNLIEIDTSVSSAFHIRYKITNKEETDVPQELSVEIQDETIAIVETNLYPFIKIVGLQAGTTKIILTCEADSSVSIEITITIK